MYYNNNYYGKQNSNDYHKPKKISKFFTQDGNSIDSIINLPINKTSLYNSKSNYHMQTNKSNFTNKNINLDNYYNKNNNSSNNYYINNSIYYNNYPLQQPQNKVKEFSNSVRINYEDIYDKHYNNKNELYYNNDLDYTNNITNNDRNLNSIICSTTGLTNLGNTCFMNTSLQILIHSENFIKRLLKKSSELGKYTPISLKFYNLCKEMAFSQGKSSITPSEFKQKFGNKHSLFRGYGQNDTQEFCRILLEDMNIELNEVKNKAPYRELKTQKI